MSLSVPRRRPVSVLCALVLLLLGAHVAVAEAPPDQEAPAESLQIRNARTPLAGVTSGGQPTEDELRQAAALGYRTVINLRTEDEELPFDEEALVMGLGMSYIELPIAGADGLTKDNVAALDALFETAEHPIVLHCSSGNRIGALMALRAHDLHGRSAEDAFQIGLDAGLTRLGPVVRERLGLPPREPVEE